MTDEIIKELWEIKDGIAREHGYNIDALIAYLQARRSTQGRQVVDLCAQKKANEQGIPAAADKPRH